MAAVLTLSPTASSCYIYSEVKFWTAVKSWEELWMYIMAIEEEAQKSKRGQRNSRLQRRQRSELEKGVSSSLLATGRKNSALPSRVGIFRARAAGRGSECGHTTYTQRTRTRRAHSFFGHQCSYPFITIPQRTLSYSSDIKSQSS